MGMKMSGRPADAAWAPVDVCTLPAVERPLRLAEFNDLFTTTLRSIERESDTRVRLFLAGGPDLADKVQQLADAESACCSFFGFEVTPVQNGLLAFDIEVPPAYADVLAGLVALAVRAQGGTR